MENLEINNNAELKIFINSIRKKVGSKPICEKAMIDAYYKSAILLFNNLSEPYWKTINGKKPNFDNYFLPKMGITFNNDKTSVINQLITSWEQDLSISEYELRGFELILEQASTDFDSEIIQHIVNMFEFAFSEIEILN